LSSHHYGHRLRQDFKTHAYLLTYKICGLLLQLVTGSKELFLKLDFGEFGSVQEREHSNKQNKRLNACGKFNALLLA